MQSQYKLLITRSERKNQDFIQKCKLKNILSFAFKGISYISSIALQDQLKCLSETKNYSWVFISPRAVEYFFQNEQAKTIIKSAKQIFAIGSVTADELSFFIPKGKIICPNTASSEFFLLLDALQDVLDQDFNIVRAQSGRNLIFDTLVRKGARVNYIESYQTILASNKETLKMIDIIDKEEIDCIIFTSFSIFRNIIEHLTATQLATLVCLTITVVNKRMFDWASEQGFANIIVLNEINNDAIIKAVIQCFKEG